MFDVAIIGSGPAGYSAAFEAIRYGMSTVLFEYDSVGGTCLNRGCVPTKYLLHVARKYQDAKSSDDGIKFQTLEIDYKKTRSKMEELICSLRTGLSENLKKSGIELVFGKAVIKGSGVIDCNGKKYEVKNIIIATGSVSKPPLVPGALTSDDILNMDCIPDKIHIIGGGTIAVEFAEIYSMLGSDVSISIRGERILRDWDKEIAIGMTQSMKKKGVTINKGCDILSMSIPDDVIVMSAVGRKANLPMVEMDLYDIGAHGGIIVDKNYQTKTKAIFAAGDVIEGSVQLAHSAMDQGRQIVRYIAKRNAHKEAAVIKCIYPNQEIASVGFTETEAREQGIDSIVAKQTMFANARTAISTEERGFIKVVASKIDGKILGAQLMCEYAGEIIAEFAMAIDQGMTVFDMLRTVRPHPSYCESLQDVLRTLEDKLNDEM